MPSIPLSKPCGVISSAKSCPVARVFVWDARGPDPNAEPPVVGIILKQNSIFRLLDLVRFSRGFPGNGLGTFPSDFMHPGRADSTPVPTRLRRVAHSNGFAVRPGIRTVVCLAAMTCRQRATRRSRVGTLPQADTAGGSRSKSAISISAEVRKSEYGNKIRYYIAETRRTWRRVVRCAGEQSVKSLGLWRL